MSRKLRRKPRATNSIHHSKVAPRPLFLGPSSLFAQPYKTSKQNLYPPSSFGRTSRQLVNSLLDADNRIQVRSRDGEAGEHCPGLSSGSAGVGLIGGLLR